MEGLGDHAPGCSPSASKYTTPADSLVSVSTASVFVPSKYCIVFLGQHLCICPVPALYFCPDYFHRLKPPLSILYSGVANLHFVDCRRPYVLSGMLFASIGKSLSSSFVQSKGSHPFRCVFSDHPNMMKLFHTRCICETYTTPCV